MFQEAETERELLSESVRLTLEKEREIQDLRDQVGSGGIYVQKIVFSVFCVSAIRHSTSRLRRFLTQQVP